MMKAPPSARQAVAQGGRQEKVERPQAYLPLLDSLVNVGKEAVSPRSKAHTSQTISRRPLSRLSASLNESELMLCGLARWKSTYDEVYDRPHRCSKLIAPTCGDPKGSCRRTATSTWPSMPALKNKKICEDVPRQLDLGPRPSFDSAHLDVPSADEFPVYLLQNGVKMINEPPRLLRSYSNLYGIRLLFTLRYDLYDS